MDPTAIATDKETRIACRTQTWRHLFGTWMLSAEKQPFRLW
jgi:hypothetical protein